MNREAYQEDDVLKTKSVDIDTTTIKKDWLRGNDFEFLLEQDMKFERQIWMQEGDLLLLLI